VLRSPFPEQERSTAAAFLELPPAPALARLVASLRSQVERVEGLRRGLAQHLRFPRLRLGRCHGLRRGLPSQARSLFLVPAPFQPFGLGEGKPRPASLGSVMPLCACRLKWDVHARRLATCAGLVKGFCPRVFVQGFLSPRVFATVSRETRGAQESCGKGSHEQRKGSFRRNSAIYHTRAREGWNSKRPCRSRGAARRGRFPFLV
jgi:hypothetical protein